MSASGNDGFPPENLGRNQSCPCGSGRRFLECCGRSSQAPAGATVRESALGKLLAFAFHPAFDSDHSIAEVLFWGNLINEGSTPELRWLLESEDATVKYNSWFLFDWEVDESGTVAEMFLQEEQAQVSEDERRFIRRMGEASLRLYEVETVVRGVGVRLVDLWTGDRVFVIERTATAQMVTWDLLGARVAPDGIGGYVFEGGLYLYPADLKASMLRQFRKLHRQHHRKFPFDDLRTFFRKQGAAFHHLWLHHVAFPDPPQLLTTEGDPLVFCRSVFEADDPEAIRAALAADPEIHAGTDGQLSWREHAGDGDHELGAWSIEGDRLVFESTSQERAARGRTWLEGRFGDRVRYRATSLETLEQTMNELRSRRPGPSPSITEEVPPESAEALRELFDRHYRAWIERPAPELGHRTPRAAAATRLWRSKVVDLLKVFENAAERASATGRPAYDFGWLWRELGLVRPGSA